ncbi:transmembrane protein 236 isoform X1 [Corythoichthys intestinalis]|uniref:transmembrane protein 236 isoform X1 n=1 Tax=Corythoichthys intestinalis TaxID=161448 RepID=UPI0025A51EF1|nr:transmembrane protein 236 isoform X1 [Corythoichthys intestinalis]XP_061794827.1 transmembrane protein 236-like [Nerophis lumbriciformis]
MSSVKKLKLAVYELLQFAALAVPTLVIAERFARLLSDLGHDNISYWLAVASSLAYVTSCALLVWVPLKYHLLRGRRLQTARWRPTALAYLILCTLPCFAIIIASSQVQMNAGVRLDHFAEMPISLVMLLLICMDLVERMRPYRLLGQSDDMDLSYELPVLTNLEMVSSVSNQLYGEENGAPANYQPEHQSKPVAPRRRPDTPAGRSTPIPSRTSGGAYLYKSSRAFSGKLGFLVKRDSRSHEFVDCFLFWFDTVEMLRVAGEPTVFYSAWVYPVFVLAFLSSLRVILAPDSPFLSLAGVVLQDFPFLILRLSLMAVFGLVTPVLFPVKNALVSLTFVYFTCMTRMKIFKRHEMF